MKTKCIFTLTGLFLLLFITSCENDDLSNPTPSETIIPETFSEYFGSEITRNFFGKVIDKNHNPISGVEISIGTDMVLTDQNGVFVLNEATVNERFAYVKANMTGFLPGSRSLSPSQGENYVEIMLIQEEIAGTVQSGSAYVVTLPNGSSVSFDGNFVKEDGSSYSGSVDVIMHHLDPTNADLNLQMPGMLYAEDTNGEERLLKTLGMLAVELRGENGEDLNLAEGSTSEIMIPLDASIISEAPQSIPLWYFDETNGYWKEEGQATLQGNYYVGTVSHFSFWNCDIPKEASIVCITVLDELGNPLSNVGVKVISQNFGTRYGYTNSDGITCGFMPNNETLELMINSYGNCQNGFTFSQDIGPFTGDDIVTITLNTSSIITEHVTGSFLACDGTAINEGYVQFTHENQTLYSYLDNGTFDFNVIRCSTTNDSFSLEGIDYTNVQTTGLINYTFTTPTTNVGTLNACNTVNEFITLQIGDDFSEIYSSDLYCSFWLNQNFNLVYASIAGFNNQDCFSLFGNVGIQGTELGTYDDWDGQNPNDLGFLLGNQECFPFLITNSNITYNIMAFGNVGDYVDMNFAGTVQDTFSVTHNVVGTIHVLRDN